VRSGPDMPPFAGTGCQPSHRGSPLVSRRDTSDFHQHLSGPPPRFPQELVFVSRWRRILDEV
jgi:hypothetical protein